MVNMILQFIFVLSHLACLNLTKGKQKLIVDSLNLG